MTKTCRFLLRRLVSHDEIEHSDPFAPLSFLQPQRRSQGNGWIDYVGQREGHIGRPTPLAVVVRILGMEADLSVRNPHCHALKSVLGLDPIAEQEAAQIPLF